MGARRDVFDSPFRYGGEANLTVSSTRVSTYYCPSDGGNRNLVGGGSWPVTSQNYVVELRQHVGHSGHQPRRCHCSWGPFHRHRFADHRDLRFLDVTGGRFGGIITPEHGSPTA